MEVKVKIEKTLHTDNDKVFYEDEDIAFEMEKTGDKYIGRIKKIKKKSIIIDDIMINREPVNIESMKVKLDDIKPYSCQYVSVDLFSSAACKYLRAAFLLQDKYWLKISICSQLRMYLTKNGKSPADKKSSAGQMFQF